VVKDDLKPTTIDVVIVLYLFLAHNFGLFNLKEEIFFGLR
jgi:hypothetical protein